MKTSSSSRYGVAPIGCALRLVDAPGSVRVACSCGQHLGSAKEDRKRLAAPREFDPSPGIRVHQDLELIADLSPACEPAHAPETCERAYAPVQNFQLKRRRDG